MTVSKWSPWRPDDYPIRDPLHNPWVPVDIISGATAFDVWLRLRPIDEPAFRRVLDELKAAST